jgi:hypothetical protein
MEMEPCATLLRYRPHASTPFQRRRFVRLSSIISRPENETFKEAKATVVISRATQPLSVARHSSPSFSSDLPVSFWNISFLYSPSRIILFSLRTISLSYFSVK